jgi:transporter family protein
MLPQWFFWTLLAILCWGLWALTSKLIGNALTAAQSQALSTLGTIPVLLILSLSKSNIPSKTTKRGAAIGFGAGVLVCLGNIAYYYALNIGGKAATIISVTALYPLVTILLALVFLEEHLNQFQLFGIALSLASILAFNINGVHGWLSGWLLYAIIPVVLWGFAGLLQKISTNFISGELSTLWFLVAFIPVAVILIATEPLKQKILLRDWLLATALGFLFSLGNLALLLAFARQGKASIITPLAGLYPLVSIPIAILFLGEKITTREWVGIALALSAVVALASEGKPKTEFVPA